MPLIVLTAMGTNPYWAQFAPADLIERTQDGIRAMHADIARSVPRGAHRILADTQHQIMHVQQPEAILAAIRDVLTVAAAEGPGAGT